MSQEREPEKGQQDETDTTTVETPQSDESPAAEGSKDES